MSRHHSGVSISTEGNWTPSIIPGGDSETVYLVADDFGRHGRCWRETDIEQTDLETIR